MTNINILIISFVFVFIATIFWFWMLADCIHHKFKHKKLMLEWFLLIAFTYFVGALTYYFMVKRRFNKF
ncbi:hypothetical protein HYX18_02665 [Candidatus Woesearchaeota archaeon]|nr:hypothetical protein [Candidatus Woesearchaeota archaeon]